MLTVFKEKNHTESCRKHVRKVTLSTVVLTHSPSLPPVRHKPSSYVPSSYCGTVSHYLFLQYELRLPMTSINLSPLHLWDSLIHSSSSSPLKHKASPHVILWYYNVNHFVQGNSSWFCGLDLVSVNLGY